MQIDDNEILKSKRLFFECLRYVSSHLDFGHLAYLQGNNELAEYCFNKALRLLPHLKGKIEKKSIIS